MSEETEALRKGISYYKTELAAIKRFLNKPKDTFQWQDWLRVMKPEQFNLTKRLSAHAIVVDDPIFGSTRRYQQLLTALIEAKVVQPTPHKNGTRLYTWVGPFPLEGS
jgi:hypothetical protein